MRTQLPFLFFQILIASICLAQPAPQADNSGVPARTTETHFDDPPENPISEQGLWFKRSNNHTPVCKSGGIAFGTQTGLSSNYDDSYAILAGFTPNQSAEGTIFIAEGVFGNTEEGGNQEVEILLRITDAADSFRGYEILLNNRGGIQFMKHHGPLNDVTEIPGQLTETIPLIKTGDRFKAAIIGNVITAFYNGKKVGQAIDQGQVTNRNGSATSPHRNGNPGMGFFRQQSGNSRNFGYTDFSANTLP